MSEEVKIEKLVHGGHGLGQLSDGRKVFVWNALPGERVKVRLTKKRRDYAEGVAEEIIQPSSERIEPLDEAYLSTSPWQIMTWAAENKYKADILRETFLREKVELPEFDFITGDKLGRAAGDADSIRAPRDEKPGTGVSYGYRNKMEYSFWGDENGLHLALFHRASHGKRIVEGSSIAKPEIDTIANNIVAVLNKNGVRGSRLKTVVLRANSKGEVVAALFVKDETFPRIDFTGLCKGVAVIFSNPKSPASVVTKQLYVDGTLELTENILGTEISYNVHSFFQVNLPVFETALKSMKDAVMNDEHIIDMYAGVGTIGLSIGAKKLIELDEQNVAMAKTNTTGLDIEVIQASTEQALEQITSDATVVFDPPRAGLHEKVVHRLLEALPEKIVYLSCNPSTQARDIAKLSQGYEIRSFSGYNFFPRTPHIESLAVLVKR